MGRVVYCRLKRRIMSYETKIPLQCHILYIFQSQYKSFLKVLKNKDEYKREKNSLRSIILIILSGI